MDAPIKLDYRRTACSLNFKSPRLAVTPQMITDKNSDKLMRKLFMKSQDIRLNTFKPQRPKVRKLPTSETIESMPS